MKIIRTTIARLTDIIASPFVLISALILKLSRALRLEQKPIGKLIFETIGIFPIRDHYYEPVFSQKQLNKPLGQVRKLESINLNLDEQLRVLEQFNFNTELLQIPVKSLEDSRFYYHNDSFGSGDAEYLYNMIRFYKPKRLIEIGSGFSTKLAIEAIKKNKHENNNLECCHVCIEPYEFKWLETLGPEIIRDVVENIDLDFFKQLDKNDILFIDSSHIIRPQGDVLYECLQILPALKPGVLIHIHDIFTPREYPNIFWNEQYLLEAFLSFNQSFRVIGALNFLAHNHKEKLSAKCPVFEKESLFREPGSFWIQKS